MCNETSHTFPEEKEEEKRQQKTLRSEVYIHEQTMHLKAYGTVIM